MEFVFPNTSRKQILDGWTFTVQRDRAGKPKQRVPTNILYIHTVTANHN
jgi:hypothetical protein